MFFAGKATPRATTIGRRSMIPTAYVATGKGERIWRPLDNPSALGGSAFQDSNPRGFGLMQRERDFERYQDTAPGCIRPSLWVEPVGDSVDGEVRLVEIPNAGRDQ